MVQQKIQLRRVRDFSENFNDTFQFIKQEFKPLALSFVSIAGIFIIGQGILTGIFERNFFSMFNLLRQNNYNNYNNTISNTFPQNSFASIFTPAYFLVILFALLSVQAMCVVIASYFKCYLLKDNSSPTIEEVWSTFRKSFLRIVLYSIIAWILVGIGLCICLVPGIYFMVVLAPFEIIVIMEDASMSEAFSRCFYLIKENFWMSFGIYAVSYLIYYFCSLITGLVIGGISGLVTYFTTKNIGTTAGTVSGILTIFSQFFFIIFYVSVCFNYFSLAEKKDGTGIMERLQTLGNAANPNESTEEQY